MRVKIIKPINRDVIDVIQVNLAIIMMMANEAKVMAVNHQTLTIKWMLVRRFFWGGNFAYERKHSTSLLKKLVKKIGI